MEFQLKNGINKSGIWYINTDLNKKVSYPRDGYDSYFQVEDNSFWFQHRNNIIKDSFSIFPFNHYFFDIGGGNGVVTKSLQQNNINAVLVEPGDGGVLNAKQRGVKNIIKGRFEACEVDGQVGPAGLFDVLEHIDTPVDFLKTIRQKMNPGSNIFITVPSYQFLWSTEDTEAGHFRRYTKKSLEKELTSAGFEIIYSTYLFHFLPPLTFLSRTIPTWLGLKNKESRNDQAKNNREHATGLIGKLFSTLLKIENIFIKRKISIPFGGSCFVIAKNKE